MERYTTFLDWTNQYCEKDYTTQSNLQINEIPMKLPIAFFTEVEQNKFTLCMKTQSTTNTQSNLQIQCNPYQITNGIFYGARTNHLKI